MCIRLDNDQNGSELIRTRPLFLPSSAAWKQPELDGFEVTLTVFPIPSVPDHATATYVSSCVCVSVIRDY